MPNTVENKTMRGKQPHQKIKPYVVLQFLLRYTDEKHAASANDIVERLKEDYGIYAERRSIYRDIDEIKKVYWMMENESNIEEAEEVLAEDDEEKLIVYDSHLKGFYVRQPHYNSDDIRLLAECVYAAKFIDENTLASEYRAFLDYNSIRSAIQDYGSTYPSFSEAASEYEAIGINENALGLLFGWFTEDTEVFSQETLLEITKLGTSGNISIKSVLSEILAKGKLVSFIAFLIVLLLCFFKRRNWLRNATVLFFSGLVALYLIFQGRFPIRVYMSILWSAVLSCVFLSSIDAKTDNPEGNATNKQLFKITPVTKKNCVVFLLMIGYLCVIGMGIWRIRNLYAGDHSTIQKEHTRILRTRNREILDTIDQNTDKIYIFDLIAEPAGTFEAFSFWEHRPADFCNNRFLLGGWDGRHPYKISLFDKYDITNPTRALFERTDVYSTYSARLLTHLRHYYDPKMTVSATDVIYDTPIVQYTAFIPDETILQSTQAVVIVDELYCSDDGLWRISASVNPDEEEHAFYVNITIDGERYTYRLAYESGEIFGALYGIDSDSDISMSDICVFERMEDNTYIKYDVFWK